MTEAKEQAEREPEAADLAEIDYLSRALGMWPTEVLALTPEEADAFARVARDRR